MYLGILLIASVYSSCTHTITLDFDDLDSNIEWYLRTDTEAIAESVSITSSTTISSVCSDKTISFYLMNPKGTGYNGTYYLYADMGLIYTQSQPIDYYGGYIHSFQIDQSGISYDYSCIGIYPVIIYYEDYYGMADYFTWYLYYMNDKDTNNETTSIPDTTYAIAGSASSNTTISLCRGTYAIAYSGYGETTYPLTLIVLYDDIFTDVTYLTDTSVPYDTTDIYADYYTSNTTSTGTIEGFMLFNVNPSVYVGSFETSQVKFFFQLFGIICGSVFGFIVFAACCGCLKRQKS